MIFTYSSHNNSIEKDDSTNLTNSAVWLDVINMSREEEQQLEEFFLINIPNQVEMAQIEVSNKLYIKNNTLYVTVLLTNAETEEISNHTITFILHNSQLITLRYLDLQAFNAFITRIENLHLKAQRAEHIFLELLNHIIERLSDILTEIRQKVDKLSKIIFSSKSNKKKPKDFQRILEELGRAGILLSKSKESLLSFVRAINYLIKVKILPEDQFCNDQLNTMLNDIHSITDYANFLSTEINFLLDASLGMINIEQNNIVKLVSVVSVIFLPPTLIASIYGMNFEFMPELKFVASYPIVLTIMVISGWLPYKICKVKKWL